MKAQQTITIEYDMTPMRDGGVRPYFSTTEVGGPIGFVSDSLTVVDVQEPTPVVGRSTYTATIDINDNDFSSGPTTNFDVRNAVVKGLHDHLFNVDGRNLVVTVQREQQ